MREAKFLKTMSVSVSEELFQTIKKVTDEKRISISEWFREVAEKELDKSNKELDKRNKEEAKQ